MKSILFFDCSPGISGAELSLANLVNKLDKNKFRVYLVTNNKKLKAKINTTEVELILINLKWMRRTANPFILIFFVLQIFFIGFWLVNFVRKRNIGIICSNTVKSFIYIYLSSFFLKIKYIVFVRDNIYQSRISQIVLKKANCIISVSEFINKQIKTDRPKKNVVYGGVDSLAWMNSDHQNTLREELGLTPEVNIVAQVSQITRWKNHFDFIKAAHIIVQRVKDVHFLIVGDCISGDEFSYKEELIKEVKCLGLSDKISFLGFRDDIKEVIAQIDILIHPAINEPFGRVLIEAMAMGKPIITYNCGGTKEIIKNNETGFLISPFDYKNIAGKSIDLLNNKTLQIQFGESGRKTIKKKFKLCNQITKIENILENV